MARLFISLYLLLVPVLLVSNNILEYFFYKAYRQEFSDDAALDFAGAFLLMAEVYPQLEASRWQQLLQEMTEQSNLPVVSRPIADWMLDDEALSMLQRGELYIEDIDDQIIFGKVADNVVVRLGPMNTIDSVRHLDTLFFVSIMALLGPPILIWAGWQQYKITGLARTTLTFSEGNLNVRAKTGFFGMPVLSRAFNQMAERVQQLFQSHRHLTNAVSHELRSPVAKIRFQLELLNEASKQGERDPLMLGISDDLDDMDTLIEEMLTYAKMERAEPDVHIEALALGEWVIKQGERLKKEVQKPLDIIIPEVDIVAQFDPLLMTRLLRNVVCNADHYAHGKIQVGVESVSGYYRLWVDDDGPGIALEERERLFEPFARVDKSRNRESGGYGLGLAIAAQIARWHSGFIEIDDSPLGGARVVLSWPVVLESELIIR